jgi:hypothetical protein
MLASWRITGETSELFFFSQQKIHFDNGINGKAAFIVPEKFKIYWFLEIQQKVGIICLLLCHSTN